MLNSPLRAPDLSVTGTLSRFKASQSTTLPALRSASAKSPSCSPARAFSNTMSKAMTAAPSFTK
jgi:hypothetical protein